ncbi:MAG: hypothetical protein IT361_11410 [Gemmatimonadaceae bacterium]|nr:hypothetical protein [Gemmatimonadaceae bacterium]
MQNRLTSLFALDELLARSSARDTARKGHRSSRKMSPPAAPASHPARPRRRGSTDAPYAQSFDTGAPIRCEHNLPRQDPGLVPLPAESAPVVAHALDDTYHVEAFEDDAPADEEEQPLSSRGIETETRATLSEASGRVHPGPAPSRFSAARSAPIESPALSLSAQMEAVERDLAELAARTTAPQDVAPTPPEAAADESSAPPLAAARGHAVFDAMAKGMNYATEFRLPAVQLSQMFSALDRELDAAVAREPAPPTPTSTPPTPTSQLITDLVGLAPRAAAPESVPPPTQAIPPDAASHSEAR